jgi:hypothetical protein
MVLTVGFFCLLGYSKGQRQQADAADVHPAAPERVLAPSPEPGVNAHRPHRQQVMSGTNQAIRETDQAIEHEVSSGRYTGGPLSQSDWDQIHETVQQVARAPHVGEVLRLQPWHPERYWLSDAVNDRFVWVAIDKPSYESAAEASGVGYAEYEESDRQHLQELYREGKVFRVSTGTKVRVLACRRTDEEMEIKLLSGRSKGRTGWIDISFVRLP